MTDTSRVLVAMRVPAPADRAFTVFTEQIGQWWRPSALFPFTAGTPGHLAFEPGPHGRLVERHPDGDVFVIGDIRVWDPPHRLVVGWRHANFEPGQDTELHVRFDEIHDAAGTQTRVTVEHHGWDTIPPKHAALHGIPLAVFQLRFAQWWRALLGEFTTVAAERSP